MTTPSSDDLLRKLIMLTEDTRIFDGHLDEQTLAEFVEGGLTGATRADVVQHLADCRRCREIVAGVLSDEPMHFAVSTVPESAISSVLPAASRRRDLRVFAATVAAILLAAGILLLRPSTSRQLAEQRLFQRADNLLAQADFDQVNQTISEAARQGILSDRLRNLHLESIRHIPSSNALSFAGRLTDFGVAYDGSEARAVLLGNLNEAQTVVDQISTESFEILLNRGHFALAQGDLMDAKQIFRRAAQSAPANPWPLLGLGLAEYLEGNYKAAERSFEECLSRSPEQLNAQINLALTLQELGKTDRARALFESALPRIQNEEDRRQIQQTIRRLQGESAETPQE